MYVRFPLSVRHAEDLLFERGSDIWHETVRMWWNGFGPFLRRTAALAEWQIIASHGTNFKGQAPSWESSSRSTDSTRSCLYQPLAASFDHTGADAASGESQPNIFAMRRVSAYSLTSKIFPRRRVKRMWY